MPKKLNILVVDDDKSIRDLFVRILPEVYNVATAADGTEAFDLAKQHPFDIAFIDMRMPKLNGNEVFTELKKIQPGLTGVMMTGYADKQMRVNAFLAGTVKYINKPFDIREVRELLLNEVDLKEKGEKNDNDQMNVRVKKTLNKQVPLFEDFDVQADAVTSKMSKSQTLNILIVEDQPEIRDTLIRVLSKKEYHIQTAKDGGQAITELKAKLYDLVVTDLKMPALDGISVLKAAKEINQNTEVIILTGYGSLKTAQEAIRAGAYDYLTKPLPDIKDFVTVVKHALEKQSLTKRNLILSKDIKKRLNDLEKVNKKLKQLDQLKSDFVSTVSHELRTPLAISLEGIALMTDGLAGEITEKQKNLLNISKENLDRLNKLINDLLDISKIESGKLELSFKSADIIKLLEGVVGSFQVVVAPKKISLTTKLPSESILLDIDKDKIIQVVVNLLNNAFKFTPENGSIEVALVRREFDVLVSVKDSGIGIKKDDLSRVFGKFQQVDRQDGPGTRGTGLGLAICKSLIEMHKGKIWVESTLNKGSEFIFTLPLTRE